MYLLIAGLLVVTHLYAYYLGKGKVNRDLMESVRAADSTGRKLVITHKTSGVRYVLSIESQEQFRTL